MNRCDCPSELEEERLRPVLAACSTRDRRLVELGFATGLRISELLGLRVGDLWQDGAQVELARGEMAGFAQTVGLLQTRLSRGADRSLPWDRRVSVSIMLARGKHADLTREQMRRCLAELDEAKLRFLPTASLYRLQVLGKTFGMEISDQRLRNRL